MRLPLIIALGLATLNGPAHAQDAAPPANIAARHGTEGAVARLLEAHRLTTLGTQMRDPVLLFAAARLMQDVTLREVTRAEADPVADPEPPAAKGKAKRPKGPSETAAPIPPAAESAVVPDPARSAPLPGALDAKALLDQARALLPAGDLLRDVIADAADEEPPPGPVAEVTSLLQAPAGATTFALPLAGQSYAEIGLLRLGAGHLTLRVTDAAGHPVCQDAAAGAAALCGLIPLESGRFLVTITNDGTDPAPYLLITN